jgi:hypothetical protein
VPSRTELKPPVEPEEEHEDVPTAIIRPRTSSQGSLPESGESPVPSAPSSYSPEVPTAIIRPRQALPDLDLPAPHHSELPTSRTTPLPDNEEFSEEVTNVRPWEGPAPVFTQLNEDAADLTRPIRPLAAQRGAPAPAEFSPEPAPLSESTPLSEPAPTGPFGAESFGAEPGGNVEDSTLPGVAAPMSELQDTHGSRRSWVMVGIFLSVLTVCAIALVMFLEGKRTAPPVLPRPPVQEPVTTPPRESAPSPEPSATPSATPSAEPPPVEPNAPRLQPADLVPLQAASAQAQAPGTLTLVTRPYAKVFLESRTLGDTPLFRLSLPAGSHTLHLIGPDKTPRVLPVVIEPGKDTRLQLPLSELPGK